jgi:hypothetical protein
VVNPVRVGDLKIGKIEFPRDIKTVSFVCECEATGQVLIRASSTEDRISPQFT